MTTPKKIHLLHKGYRSSCLCRTIEVDKKHKTAIYSEVTCEKCRQAGIK